MAINYCCIIVVVHLLTLKLLIFSLVIAYFGMPRLHQIAPFVSLAADCYSATYAPAMQSSF